MASEEICRNVMGQRYIACGQREGKLRLQGTPGNALGAYLNGASIELFGNAQDATGDTMNDGEILIHGNTGDAAGYAMRGGCIYVEANAGYRAGIHMKAYGQKQPLLMIGGRAGSFLGEYLAGGTIIVLGRNCEKGTAPVGYFCGTGMHGGQIFIRCETLPADLPDQVSARKATEEDLLTIQPYLQRYCQLFDCTRGELAGTYYLLRPNESNPYHMLYVRNWGNPV